MVQKLTEMVHPLVPKWFRLIRHVARVPKLDCTEVVHPVPKWSFTELVLTRQAVRSITLRTLCDPIWQVTPRSSVMGFPLGAILGF